MIWKTVVSSILQSLYIQTYSILKQCKHRTCQTQCSVEFRDYSITDNKHTSTWLVIMWILSHIITISFSIYHHGVFTYVHMKNSRVIFYTINQGCGVLFCGTPTPTPGYKKFKTPQSALILVAKTDSGPNIRLRLQL